MAVISLGLCVLLYAGMSYKQHKINPDDTTMPGFAGFAQGFKVLTTPRLAGDYMLWTDVKSTTVRFSLGFSVGIIMSICVGLLMGCVPIVEAFFNPPISIFSKFPPTAMLAVYFVAFGRDLELFIALTSLAIFCTLTQSVYLSAKNDVSEQTIDKSFTLGASVDEVVLLVIFPQIFPRLLDAIRISVIPALTLVVAAEWLLAGEGFGYQLKIQSKFANMNVCYIYILILGITGFLLDNGILRLRRKLCPWYGENNG